jgi:hypothetical protein
MADTFVAEFMRQQGGCPACCSGTALTIADYCGAKPLRVCCRCGSEVPAT